MWKMASQRISPTTRSTAFSRWPTWSVAALRFHSFGDLPVRRWILAQADGVQELVNQDDRRLMSVTVGAKATEFVNHTPEPMFSLAGIRLGGNFRTYDVAPDGERFLFTKDLVGASSDAEGSASSRVIVVENWFEELKRRVPVN